MASFVSWNCRGIKNKFSDLKDIINLYQPSVIALQETYLKPGDTLPLKNFNILLKNGTGDRATGGVALLTSTSFPTSPITLNTPLQAIAVQIHTNSLISLQHTVAIFFDIEKAYDRSWRFGILRDLYECNLRGNLPIFIQNFLKLRKFRVQIGNQLSDYFIQEEGVPQGSVFSVTLFALKINDILKQLPPSVKGFLYVDDLYISCTGDNINFIERQLQLAVNKIQQWSTFHGFTFSTSKTSCIHFCRKRRLHPEPEILLGIRLITVVDEVKFLGITFDKKLTFRPHVIKLRKKLDKALNILKVLSNTSWGASRTSLLRVYRAAILSKMDYGCVIYGSARQSVLKILDPIHHSALRLCSGAFRTSPVESLC
ncbi:RNA-directed DNA polymerase from mobile element jockey [Araneus ventricosus]|uniref:RNA-directed DNA polymerase from mobile element jockey n=1 Tax=Araneus ventricosus TaxID=182803 RepID=A0A4Y2T1Q3_ARAVE|nr:RNA-directed DNA polymerase from mobile element jockey [Araneus ventricosus]